MLLPSHSQKLLSFGRFSQHVTQNDNKLIRKKTLSTQIQWTVSFHILQNKKVLSFFNMQKQWFYILLINLAIFFAIPFSAKCQSDKKLYKYQFSDSSSVKLKHKKKVKDSLQITREHERIFEQLLKTGYLGTSIDTTIADSTAITAFFYKGIHVNTNIDISTINRSALLHARLHKSSTISLQTFLQNRTKIIEYYENNGFPFANIVLASPIFKNNSYSAKAIVNQLDFYTIDSIVIEGNIQIRKDYIYRITDIAPKSIYNQSKIDNACYLIESSMFMSCAAPPEIIFHNKSATIIFHINKEKSNMFDGIIGFAPNPADDNNLEVTGKVQLHIYNAFKHGEQFRLQWEKLKQFSQKLEVQFAYDYWMGTIIGSDIYFNLKKQDTTFLTTHFTGEIPFAFEYNNRVSIFYTNKNSTLLSKQATTSAHATYNTNLWGLGYKFRKLDYYLNPRKGISLKLNIAAGIKEIKQNNFNSENIKEQTSNHIESTLTLSSYLPITRNTVIKTTNYSGYINDLNMVQNELFTIGGAKILRGFDEESIFASSYSVFSFEYRILFDKKSNIFVFADQAWYENTSGKTTISDTPLGFGAGLNIQNKSSIFSISYAYGRQLDNPVDYRAAKIHFGYINKF